MNGYVPAIDEVFPREAEAIEEAATRAAERVARERTRLLRSDGTRTYGDAEHAERDAGILEAAAAAFDADTARYLQQADRERERAEAELARLDGADGWERLTEAERQAAATRQPFVKEDVETLPPDEVARRARAALAAGDKAACYLWARYVRPRVEGASSGGSAPPVRRLDGADGGRDTPPARGDVLATVARTCTTCAHPERRAIDRELATGHLVNRRIAARTGLAESSVRRHAANHLPARLVAAAEAEDVAHAIDVVGQLRAINAATLAVLAVARARGDGELALKAVDRVQRQIELQAKLLGELDERPQVNVLVAPEWLLVRSELLSALGPYPEARMAVAARLVALEGGRGAG